MKENEVIDDWVDREEVRALAEKLMTPPGGSPKSLDDAVYGEAFEGFMEPVGGQEEEEVPAMVGERVLEPTRKDAVTPTAPVVDPVQRNPFTKKDGEGNGKTIGSTKVTPVSPPFRAARATGTAEESPRSAAEVVSPLASFVTWLRGEIPLDKVLITGGRGEVVFDDLKDGKLASVATILARAAHQQERKELRAMVVKLGPKRVMQVIPFSGLGGPSFAGLVLPRPLADGGVKAFVTALEKAIG